MEIKIKTHLLRCFSFATQLCKKRYFPLCTRFLCLLFFFLFLLALFYGTIWIVTIPFTSSWAMFLIWVLWWPFLYITIFFFGRIWCGFLCPLVLATEMGNKIWRGKAINYRKLAFIPFVLFFIIVYIEQVSGLFLSAKVTLLFFLSFFALAFFFGIVLPRYSFCKLICPIGTLLGVFSRLSLFGLRTKKEICEKCSEKFCILGGKTAPCPVFLNVPALNSNKDCLLCAKCIKNCPHDSAAFGLISPGKELGKKINFTLSESFFIIALFGLALVLTTNGTALTREISALFPFMLTGALLRAADFLIALALFLSIFLLLGFCCANLLRINLVQFLSEAGYSYLPLIFFIMFYTITFGFLGPWLPLNTMTVLFLKYFFLGIGASWSAFLIWEQKKENAVRMLLFFFLGILILLWAGLVIADPLHLVTEEKHIFFIESGTIVQIESYSMGFNPNVLIVEKGTPVVLNITNIDIMHAFDLDAFDVHYVLFAGDAVEISFIPDRIGEFPFFCTIPGHTEAGMKGKIIVVDSLEEYKRGYERKAMV